MFGITAFADAPFASFAGVQFSDVSETATATDAVVVAASIFNAPVVETATATDAISSAQTFETTISETGTSTDLISSTQTFPGTISETSTATDAVGSVQVFVTFVSETATATDVFVGGFLWNLIDDTQSANWTGISTAGATGGWVTITVDPATTWQPIGTVN